MSAGFCAGELLMKLKLDRIISIATLLVAVTALVLVMKKPAPVAPPLPPAAAAASVESFQNKIEQLEQAQGHPGTEVRLNGQEVTAAIAQATGALTEGPTGNVSAPSSSAGDGSLSGDL